MYALLYILAGRLSIAGGQTPNPSIQGAVGKLRLPGPSRPRQSGTAQLEP
jgi:hypothetical protein